MSDGSTTPGQHPAFPPVPPAPQIPPYPHGHQLSYGQQYPAQPHHPPLPYSPAQPHHPAQTYASSRPTSGVAVTALVTGIAGIVFSWTFVALLASVAAVISGHMALKQTRNNVALGGRGMAIAGLVLGYIGAVILAFSVIIGIFSFLFIGSISFLPVVLA